MGYRYVIWTSLVLILFDIVAIGIGIAAGSFEAQVFGFWLALPAIGLFQVAAILKQQQERITRLEQARDRLAEQPASQTEPGPREPGPAP